MSSDPTIPVQRVPTAGDRRDAVEVLVVENSRVYAGMVAEALRTRLGLPVTVASSLAQARRLMAEPDRYFLALTGLVLADADRSAIVEFFAGSGVPTIVVSGVYDETLRERIVGRSIVDFVLKNAPGNIDYLVWLVQRLERNRRIAALIVDDSPSARRISATLLSLYGFRVVEAADAESALAALAADEAIRVIVVDYRMPGMDGIEFTRRVRMQHARDKLAIVGVSGTGEPTLVAQFLKNGANDFLRKPFSRDEFFCRIAQNVDNLELIGTLQDLATKDFLTGLPNRRDFFARGNEHFERARDERRPVVAAMIDIDHFKHVNDTHGHEVGDRAIKAVAQAVARHMRDGDIAARFGGEEFCVLACDLEPLAASRHFESLRQRIAGVPIPVDGGDIHVTASIGVCLQPMLTLHAMLSEADRQLYLAKADGRNRVELDV